jgi:hypothetical protein
MRTSHTRSATALKTGSGSASSFELIIGLKKVIWLTPMVEGPEVFSGEAKTGKCRKE